jgi:hypothetical protein
MLFETNAELRVTRVAVDPNEVMGAVRRPVRRCREHVEKLLRLPQLDIAWYTLKRTTGSPSWLDRHEVCHPVNGLYDASDLGRVQLNLDAPLREHVEKLLRQGRLYWQDIHADGVFRHRSSRERDADDWAAAHLEEVLQMLNEPEVAPEVQPAW